MQYRVTWYIVYISLYWILYIDSYFDNKKAHAQKLLIKKIDLDLLRDHRQ